MFLQTPPNNKSSNVNLKSLPINDSTNQYKPMNNIQECDFESCIYDHMLPKHTSELQKMDLNNCKRFPTCDVIYEEGEEVPDDINDPMYACAKSLNLYKCKKCPRFRTDIREGLRLHKRSDHAGVNFGGAGSKCRKCNFTTYSRYLLLRHKLFGKCVKPKVDNSSWYSCEFCDYKGEYYLSVEQHIERLHHVEQKCGLCPFQMGSKNTFNMHTLLKHTDADKINWLKCQHCDYKSRTQNNIPNNEKRHFRCFKCELCNFQTNYKYSLKKHVSSKHTKRGETQGILNRNDLSAHTDDNQNPENLMLNHHKKMFDIDSLRKNVDEGSIENVEVLIKRADGDEIEEKFNLNVDVLIEHKDDLTEDLFCLNMPDPNKNREDQTEEDQNLNLHDLSEHRGDKIEEQSSLNRCDQNQDRENCRIEENQNLDFQGLGYRDDQSKNQNQQREEYQTKENKNLNVYRRDDQIAEQLNLNMTDLNKHKEDQQINGTQNINVCGVSDHGKEPTNKNQTEMSNSDAPVLKKRRQGPVPIYPKYNPNALSVVNVFLVQPVPSKRKSRDNDGNYKPRDSDAALKCRNCRTVLDAHSELSMHIKKLCKKPTPKRATQPSSPPPPEPLSFQVHIQNFSPGVCRHCKATIDPNTDMTRHIQKLCQPVPKEPVEFCCKSCSFRTKIKKKIKYHVLVKHADTFFHCELCPFKTKLQEYLNRHVSNMHTKDHEGKWLGCEDCGYKTKSKVTMTKHVKTHQNKYADKTEENIEWLECEHCKYKFKDQNTFAKHVNDCARVARDTFSCEFCSYRTKCLSYLEKHIVENHSEQEKNSVDTEECMTEAETE